MKGVLRLAWLVLVALAIPSTSAAPTTPITALARWEILADGFLNLRGIVVAPDGSVYVADREAGTVTRLAPDGARTLVAGTLARPVGLAFDPSGHLLVAEERAGRVLRVEADGTLTTIVGNVNQPRWLAVSGDGTMFISARASAPAGEATPDDESAEPDSILAATAPGQVSIFAQGFQGVQGLAVGDGVLYAAMRGGQGSAAQGRIVQIPIVAGAAGPPALLTADGNRRPIGLAIDARGAVFVSTSEVGPTADPTVRGIDKVPAANAVHGFASALVHPQGLAFDGHGHLLVADGSAGRILRFHAPAPPIIGAVPPYTRQSPLSISVTTEPSARVEATVNDGPPTASAFADSAGAAGLGIVLAPNAANALDVFATGHGGDGLTSPPATVSVTHDDQTPTISLQTPSSGAAVRQVVTVSVGVSDGGSGVADLSLSADGKSLAGTLVPRPPAPAVTATAVWDTTTIADGVHTLAAAATDRAGNMATASRSVTVDNTPPQTRIVGGPVGLHTSATATFIVSGTDNLTPAESVQFAWRLDGREFTPFAATTTIAVADLAEGTHTFEVKARDLAGNEDPLPARRKFTVMLTPPKSGAATGATPPGPSENQGLTIAPVSAPVIQGSGTTFRVTVEKAPAVHVEPLTLSATGLPPGVTATFVPASIRPGQSVLLLINAASTAAVGHATFTVAGAAATGKASTKSAPIGLTVLASGRTALIGRVVDTDRDALEAVAITLDDRTVFTDANGNFLMLDAAAGEHVVLIDGGPASTADRRYPTIPASVTILAGRTNELPYLPHLHRQKHTQFTPIQRTLHTVATDTELPGAALHLEAGNDIIGWDGQPADKVSIRTVPADRLPVRPLPSEVTAAKVYMFYFGKRGGGIPRRPVPFQAPNDLGLAPGEKADLWYFDESPIRGEAPNDWRIAGTGTVSADGRLIVTDPGVGLPKFCCGAAAWNGQNTGATAKPGPASQLGVETLRADPVDLATGIFMLTKTDMVLPGRLPVALTRTYRSGEPFLGPFGRGTSMGFEDFILLTSPTVITYVYRANARTQFLQQPDFTYTNTTVPAFRGAVFRVNADGTRTLRYKDGRSVTFTGVGLQIAVSDRNGNTVTITRESDQNATRLIEPAGRTLTLTWVINLRDLLSRVTDPLGRTVQYQYDELNRLTAVTDPAGGVTSYAYDAEHRMTTITDARGIVFLTNTYDVNSRVCQQTQADSGVFRMYYVTADIATTPASVQLLNEAAAGGPISQAPCNAAASSSPVVATVLVDPRGKPATYRFNSFGALIAVTDALGQTTTYERDPATNLVLSVTDALGRVTRYTYDGNGNVLTIRRLFGTPDAVTTSFMYDPTFNQITGITDPLNHITTFGYDTHGNPTSVTDPLSNVTTIAYNSIGQPTSVTSPLNNTTTFTYDANGNLATITDALGNTASRFYGVSSLLSQSNPVGAKTIYRYDALNRLTNIIDGKLGVTQFSYDPNGNLLGVTDALNHTTGYTYDSMDRTATRTDPLGRAETYTYDLNGNLTSFTDRKSQVTSRTYDALNRLSHVTFADASTTTYTWDAGNRMTQIADSISGTITRSYDLLDRLTQETTPQGTVSYTYDAAGRRTSMTVTGQPPATYAYDNANRLTSITQGTSIVNFAYDAASRRTSLTLPNGVMTQYTYDTASRLTGLTYKLGTTTLGTLTYTYDARGNRLEVGGTWARTGIPEAVASASYNAGNQQLTFGGQTLTYDFNGNLMTDGINSYAWNARDQLSAIAGPVSASFLYDAAGRRSAKAIAGNTTTFLYDGLNMVQEQAGAAMRNVSTGPDVDEYLARDGGGDAHVFLADALGSTWALVDGTGAIQAEYTYDPFGTTTVTGSPGTNALSYTGREDDGTGLKHHRARYYHPRLQRFLSEDPVRSLDHPYGYVRQNPTNLTDPLGLIGKHPWTESPDFKALDAFLQGLPDGAYIAGVEASAYGIVGGDVSTGPLLDVKTCPNASKQISIGWFVSGSLGAGLGVGASGFGGYYGGGVDALRGASNNLTGGVGPASVTVALAPPTRPNYGGPVIIVPPQPQPAEVLGVTAGLGKSAPVISGSVARGETLAGAIGPSCRRQESKSQQ